MRKLTGKSARLSGIDFDKKSVNTIEDSPVETEIHSEVEAKVDTEKTSK